MTSDELIGKVAVEYLRDRLSEDDTGGTARYLLDCLTADQTAAIAKAVLVDPYLLGLIDVKLPVHFVGKYDLPKSALTEYSATYFRSASCQKAAYLLANVGDDQQQSLKELIPVGTDQLRAHPDLWVNVASVGLPLNDQHKTWWTKALKGLLEVRSFALDQFAEYILQTQKAIMDGQPILCALGVAFHALRIPKDTNYFKSLNTITANHLSKWKGLYSHAIKKRACYLVKQTPTQALLTEDNLLDAFEKVKNTIPEVIHPQIESFIREDSGWNKTAESLAHCEWEWVKPLFDGLKRERFNLGQATLDFYDEREDELITDAERDYLNRLIDRKTTEAQEEDEQFYRDHRTELKEKPSLKAKWDHFIYGSPVEIDDFLVGIAICLEALFDQDIQNSKRKLRIQCDRKTQKDLKDLNVDAGLFFVRRYKGLQRLFGNSGTWDVGKLFDFEQLTQTWRLARKPLNRSVAKSSLQLKFFLELDVILSNGEADTYSKQLIWVFNPNAVPSEFYGDWSRLVDHPLVYCRANREPVSGKGCFQSLDLKNVKTLIPTYDKDRGSFISIYKKDNDISLLWPINLNKAQELGIIHEQTASKLLSLFQTFQTSYSAAIKEFACEGLVSEFLLKQLTDYGILLYIICKEAKGDRNRDLLLRPLLSIGTVAVEGGRVTAIVTPWHPLRLAAIAIKAHQVASLVKHLLTAEEIYFGDTRLFFKELKEEFKHPYYPEIVLGWSENKLEILSLTDYYLDYSLHELPIVTNEGFDDTNESPSESSSLILELIKKYLSLYPHEQANFTVVLYNCDSARLPQAIVDKIHEIHEDKEDMRCQVILRHRDRQKLRDLYEKIIESSENDADSFVASEATRDFMARLRIGIMVDQAPVPDPKDGPPADIVFLQDVIARHAKLEWYPAIARPEENESLIPARWSRRRPSAVDDMKSVVYLCCPVQSREGWAFITAITTFFKGDWDGIEERRLLPARQLDFIDPETASIFKEIHTLGNWVVNYDELLDRRQLLNQNVKVIRYKQATTQGRNILISSKASLGLLRSMVFSRIKDLNLELSDEDCYSLTEKFINDANEISGDIVLRAAKRGRNASELMGIVLSRYMIHSELGMNRYFGWYFLDDYADWLGQREQRIADILVLSPEMTKEENLRLAVVISEAKYIDAANLLSKRKESQKQLRDTLGMIGNALFGDPKRLDRDLWLSRFSDLVLNGIQFPAYAPINLANWRHAIRDGECEIYLRGYSHIFVSGPTDTPECSDFTKVAGLEDSYQEVFSRDKLRELVLSYWKNLDPLPIRQKNAGENVWEEKSYRIPTERFKNILKRTDQNKQNVDNLNLIESGKLKPAQTVSQTKFDEINIPMYSQTSIPKDSEVLSACWPYSGIKKLIIEYKGVQEDSSADAEWMKQIENLCKGALQQFQLQAKLISSTLTPNAALLKFQGSTNLTVEQVLKRRSEFLTTHRLNVISVRAEPGVVAISIARPRRRVLQLLELWKKWNPDCLNGNSELLIGLKEEDGNLLFLSPKKNAPHTLIAGSTGSGKSVLMQNIILAIACTNTPSQSQIVLIDPKHGVDYFAFEKLPHLQGGIIDSQQNAILTLNRLIDEMDIRYTILKQNKVANIFDLNNKKNVTEHLPFMWIVHDEFAEWMMINEYREAVTNIVSRLGIKARAAGIFLVFAAQRPDANVMPMQLRANLGNRLILRVDSEGTSEIALGEKGAERLLGKGHLAAKLEGEDNLIIAQVPFIKPEELENIVLDISS